MKAPKRSTDTFPPLTLTAHQETEFRHLARNLVRETLTHAISFQRLPESERDLAKQKRWKIVTTRGGLTVFKERNPPKIITGTSFDTPEHQRLTDDEWQMPKLLVGVGSIVGSLEDVMYGVVTPDAQAMLLKAGITRSSFADGAVLAQIDGPTPEAPYRFLGIKWFDKKGPSATLRSFVQSRGLVAVEATGVLTRSNGDRIGYHLLHSVDLDGYGALRGRWLTRGRISSCTIFKETQDGRQVDVYVRGYVEQHGKLLNSVALKVASTGFLSSWNAIECSHAKKLKFFLENPHLVTWKQDAATRSQSPDACTLVRSHASTSHNGSSSMLSPALTSLNDRCGGTCSRKMKKGGLCSLCQLSMCSKCRVTKRLISVTCEEKLERQEKIICRSCVAKVRLEPVISIAQQEISESRYRWRPGNQSRQACSAKIQAPKPVVSSPTCGYATSNPTSEPHFLHFSELNASKTSPIELSGTAASLLDRQRLHQLEQQQSQASNARLEGRKIRWFRRHKKREQIRDGSRPVLFGEYTMLSECQLVTLSQCSTVADSTSTTSPINPLTCSWSLSVQESESRAFADEGGMANTREVTENQYERQELWDQMTELQLAVENTYQIAKHTTVLCCGPSPRPN